MDGRRGWRQSGASCEHGRTREAAPCLHGSGDLVTEHHLQAANVTLGPIGDEDLVGGNAAIVQGLCNLAAECSHALLWAIARVALLGAEPARARDKAIEDMFRHRLRRVTDAQADDVGVRILLEECVAPPPNLWEEVARLQLLDVGVAAHCAHAHTATAWRAAQRRATPGEPRQADADSKHGVG